jgi:tetratricopeptide (TPR) repeat protein
LVHSLLAAVWLFSAPASARPAGEWPGLLAEAQAALDAGDYVRAEALFSRGLAADPSNPEFLFGLGAVYQDTEREPMAATIYARLVAAGHLEFAGRLLVRAPREGQRMARTPEPAAGDTAEPQPHPPPAAYAEQDEDAAPPAPVEAGTRSGAVPTSEPSAASATPGADLEAQFPLRVHLASYRRYEQALAGWQVLLEENADLLGDLQPDVKKLDLGPGEGVYFRLRGGPLPSEDAAKALCRKLRARGLYCALAYF